MINHRERNEIDVHPAGAGPSTSPTANYGSHSVSIFNVTPSGLTPLPGSPFATGSTNKSPYSVAFRPTSTLKPPGLRVAANWLSDNTLSVFPLSQSGAAWSVGTPTSFKTGAPINFPGSGPEEVAFHPVMSLAEVLEIALEPKSVSNVSV